jgi:hypothetical protein
MPDTILKRWNGSAFEELYPKTTVGQISASGTPSSTTFLRGDGQWVAPTATVSKDDLKYLYIYGKAQSAITKGQAVQFAGVQGDHILMKPAVPSEINANPDYFIGLAEATLATNDFGYILTQGELVGLNTNSYTAGDILWFASAGSTAGALTATEPTNSNARIQVASVNKVNASAGILFVRVNFVGTEIEDIVATGTPSSSNFLRGDGQWATPSGSGDVVGPSSSVANRIVTFNGTTGKLIQDSGLTSSSFAAASHTHTYGDLTGTVPTWNQNTTGNAATATNADTVDGYHAAGLWRSDGGAWNPGANITLGQTANGQEWSFDISRNGFTGGYWHVWDSVHNTMLAVNAETNRVGIGTASPAHKLDVAGVTRTQGLHIPGLYSFEDSSQGIQLDLLADGYNAIRFYQGTTPNGVIHSFSPTWQNDTLGNSAGALNIDAPSGVTFGSWDAPQLAIRRSDGNVGIGTTSPLSKLHVQGDITGQNTSGFSSIYRQGGIYFTWDAPNYGTNPEHSIRSTYGNDYGDHITLNSFGHIRMNIDSNNNGTNNFEIGAHTTGTGNTLFQVTDTGNTNINSNLTVTGGTNLINKNNPAISNGSYVAGSNHIELRTTDLSHPSIGFHRSGGTAVTLYHDANNSLRLRDANTGLDSLMWHAGNDGASSGLDADLLDGNHASAFALASHTHPFTAITGTATTAQLPTITVAKGGTGQTSYSNGGGVMYYNSQSGIISSGNAAGSNNVLMATGYNGTHYFGNWVSIASLTSQMEAETTIASLASNTLSPSSYTVTGYRFAHIWLSNTAANTTTTIWQGRIDLSDTNQRGTTTGNQRYFRMVWNNGTSTFADNLEIYSASSTSIQFRHSAGITMRYRIVWEV